MTDGYKKYVYMGFRLDGTKMDTLLEEQQELRPADCETLLYDAYHLHAGPAGASDSKIFLGFSNMALPHFKSVTNQQRPRHLEARLYPKVF